METSFFDLVLDPAKIGPWFHQVMMGWGLSDAWANFIGDVIGVLLIVAFVVVSAIYLIWLERKVAARLQDRLGPNRAGPYGLFQTFADIVKLLTKEDVVPEGADKLSFNFAPALPVFQIVMVAAILPFGPAIIGADLNVGVLYIIAIGGMAAMGALMAGWSSNNKYALLGGFRVVAQLLSYEIPLVLTMLAVVLFANTMRMNGLAEAQGVLYFGFFPGWYIFVMPLAFILFYVAALAEGERAPFDLLEAESELVAGFFIEYSGMKFAWFYLQFFVNSLLLSAIITTLFLGGWQGPFVSQVPVLGIVYFFVKTTLVLFSLMWVRATYPRLRIDQMMAFCWKVLVPLALVTVLLAAVVVKLPVSQDIQFILLSGGNIAALLAGLGLLGRSLRKKSEVHRTAVPVRA